MVLAAAKILTRPESLEILSKLGAPENIWKYFLVCTETPRPSGFLGPIQKKLADLAGMMKLECEQDKVGNVVIRKPGSKGLENASPICIQCHMDMVGAANEETKHDFEKDPISPRIDGDWLYATGTSLGGDDGIGMAIALAVLEDEEMAHPPLECLFTADEETTMSGAEGLAGPPFLKSRLLINVDSEEEYAICVGCAGGFDSVVTLPVKRETKADAKRLQVVIKGLRGGHTGVDIQHPRANAILCMARLLRQVGKELPLQLESLVAGNVTNALPREATAVVVVEDAKTMQAKLEKEFAVIAKEFATTDPSAVMLCAKPKEQAVDALDKDSTIKAFDVLLALPHGVSRMSPDVKGLVETSSSVSVAFTEAENMVVKMLTRSSSGSQMKFAYENLKSIGRLAGAKVSDMQDSYPGWLPNMKSPLLAAMKKAHVQSLGKEADVYAIHAGLECGIIQGPYPDMDCVSIGPTVENPHSPDERVLIGSVGRFWTFMKEGMAELSKM